MIRRQGRCARLALAAAGAACAVLPASTGAAAAQTTLERLSAADLFDLAGEALRDGRVEDAFAIYDALSRDPDPDVRAEARFRKGMTLAELRRFAEAAAEFRAILDEKPEAARVRLELARMHAALGDEAAARRELRQAQATGLPPEVAHTISQFARAIRSPRRLGGSVGFALAPDSNINRATDARTLDTIIAPLVLSEDARAQSGIGFKPSAEAFARLPLSETVSLVPRVAGVANLYRARAYEDISGSALIGLEWRRSRSRISGSVGETRRWFGRRPYARTSTLALDWLYLAGPRTQIVVSGSAGKADYLQNDLQDGAIYDLNVAVERALDARSGGSLTLSATRQTARDPGYATAGGGATLTGWRELGGTTLFASAGLRRTEGDARLFLFPERRKEWLFTARAGATLRQFRVDGFAPTVRVTYERNASTVGIYDYKRLATEFGIVRAF
ncbi:MAG: surface lipoprotein assembly modifier [Allosphingosinicella sp.]|uniref:surface lipoprotein assembly modifier n=1 Tax=Allosphingosinicella sp. TaxID=2823234 RepID=UPI003958DA63